MKHLHSSAGTWQYKKYGNSTEGEKKLKECKNTMEAVDDNGSVQEMIRIQDFIKD